MCAFSRDCIGTGKANMYVEKTDLHMACFSDTVLESVTAMCRILFFVWACMCFSSITSPKKFSDFLNMSQILSVVP